MTSTVFFSMGLIRTAAILAINNRLGGYNFKTSPFLGGKFFTGKKHEGVQIL